MKVTWYWRKGIRLGSEHFDSGFMSVLDNWDLFAPMLFYLENEDSQLRGHSDLLGIFLKPYTLILHANSVKSLALLLTLTMHRLTIENYSPVSLHS